MPKPKTDTRIKLKAPPADLRALIEKRHQERFEQLARTTKVNGEIASRLAALINLRSEDIPPDLLRDLNAAAERAHGNLAAKATRKGRR